MLGFGIFWLAMLVNVPIIFLALVVVRADDYSDLVGLFLLWIGLAVLNSVLAAVAWDSPMIVASLVAIPVVDWFLLARFAYGTSRKAAASAAMIALVPMFLGVVVIARYIFSR